MRSYLMLSTPMHYLTFLLLSLAGKSPSGNNSAPFLAFAVERLSKRCWSVLYTLGILLQGVPGKSWAKWWHSGKPLFKAWASRASLASLEKQQAGKGFQSFDMLKQAPFASPSCGQSLPAPPERRARPGMI